MKPKNILRKIIKIYYGENAFSQCSELIEIENPKIVKQICSHAFEKYINLSKINWPNLKVISECLFGGCSNLKEIKLHDSVEILHNGAFYESGIVDVKMRCKSLLHVKLSNKITKISQCSFCQCYSLLNVEIPNSVKEICGAAFYGCSSLINIDIPESVIEIGGASFHGCS